MTLQPLNSNLPHSEPSELTVISTEDDDLLNNFLSSPTPKRLIKGITISHAGDKVVSEYQIGGFLGKVHKNLNSFDRMNPSSNY
jgi:hypothetical protein